MAAVAHAQSNRTRPTARLRCSEQRVRRRDSWNTSEIRVEELLATYDRDGSGVLEQDEFREVLRDFNAGVAPSTQEVQLMLRLADTNRDGTISQTELHYAMRAWHCYRHLDDNALRLFSEFDADESGRLDFHEMKALLTNLNAGVPVSLSEVQWVMDTGDMTGDGRLDRSEVLGAIAAWYVHVERRSSDLQSLVTEALTRTAKETDHGEALKSGVQQLAHAAALLSGGAGGYDRVGNSSVMPSDAPPDAAEQGRAGGFAGRLSSYLQPWSQGGQQVPLVTSAAASLGGGAPSQDDGDNNNINLDDSSRTKQVALYFLVALGKFCYVFFPFILGQVLLIVGICTHDNQCPRNLDGLMVWFGIASLAFAATTYLEIEPWSKDLRLTIGVILVLLDFVGLAWSNDGRVQLEEDACGVKLVLWSKFFWPMVPISASSFVAYRFWVYLQHLRNQDEKLQQAPSVP
eukprot:CAMPEP_0206601786 /NCGR_PEP_ID=MMETSP0325_2-20121206/46874_1 /ASSEMBLY_ACC=CAM_ASM_000347 /TAXON_ID=2866 /ORGANISM="Crypthecodinium cohnii, Strain Seligo" /LENGTH=459 /DNA_ID=CAMNT_0054113899 /DNA_START=111 /DNA_END=1487 /DNA_ORIENTATION=-